MRSLVDELQASVRSGRLITYNRWVQRPKVYPAASERTVAEAEAQLGFALPQLLRDIYLRVANGGFGPGYGLLGIDGGAGEPIGGRIYTALDLYEAFRTRDGFPTWPDRLLPIAYWGCEIYSCIDCAVSDTPVMALDPNRHGEGPWRCDCRVHAKSFADWLQRWVDGEDLGRSIPLTGPPKFWFEQNA